MHWKLNYFWSADIKWFFRRQSEGHKNLMSEVDLLFAGYGSEEKSNVVIRIGLMTLSKYRK